MLVILLLTILILSERLERTQDPEDGEIEFTYDDGLNNVRNIATGNGNWTDLLGLAPALGGVSYWKQFEAPKGIKFSPNLRNHLVNGLNEDGIVEIVRKGNKGLKGAHNLDDFNVIARNNNFNIVSKTESSDIKGLFEIEYQLPKLSNKPKPGTKELYPIGGFKPTIDPPKTVYDPQRFSDELIFDLGQKASNKFFKKAMKTGERSDIITVGGMRFEIHLDSKTQSYINTVKHKAILITSIQ